MPVQQVSLQHESFSALLAELGVEVTFISIVAGVEERRGAVKGNPAASAVGVLERRIASARAAAVRVLSTLLPTSESKPASWANPLSDAAAVEIADLVLWADSLE